MHVETEEHKSNVMNFCENMSNRRMRSSQNKQGGSRLARGLKLKEKRKRRINTLANTKKAFTGVGKHDNERRNTRRGRGRGADMVAVDTKEKATDQTQ